MNCPIVCFHTDNRMKLVPAPFSDFFFFVNVLDDTEVKVYILTYYFYQFEPVKNLV